MRRKIRGVLSKEEALSMTAVERKEALAAGWLFPIAGADRITDKVKEIDGEISTLTIQKGEAFKRREDAVKKYSESDNFGDIECDEFKAAKQATADHGTIEDKIVTLQNSKAEILMLRPSSNGGGNHDDIVPHGKADLNGVKQPPTWSIKALLESEDRETGMPMAERLKAIANSSARIGKIELGEVVSRDDFKADLVGTTNMRRGNFGGVAPAVRRPLRVLDLMSVGTMTGNTIPYVQEGGTFAAAETTEGAAKPEAGVTLTDATATAVTVAHWKKLQKQSLEDSEYLQSRVESHLRYGVQRRLEGQIIAGDGSAPNMRGIRNTSGIGTVAFSGSVPIADLILSGIVNVLAADGEPDAVALNPIEWGAVLSAKATGSGEYLGGGPFSAMSTTVWGIEAIPTNALASGDALVGDYSQGAHLFIRSGVNVLMSDSDQDDFIKNKVTLLGEGRFALTVDYPGFFSYVDTKTP